MLRDSRDPPGENAQPSVRTRQKWKADITVGNAESVLKIKEIISAMANKIASLAFFCRKKETGHMDQEGECKRHRNDLKYMEPKTLFTYKGSLRRLTSSILPNVICAFRTVTKGLLEELKDLEV